MPLLHKFKETIRQYNLINSSDTIVIGVSGGPDSLCLLYLLNSLKRELNLTLHIAHLNHMLRGGESRDDAQFVSDLSRRLNIPATIKEADITAMSRKGSPEETARKARLDFLFEVAGKIKAGKIALGHNLDDQAETVLMRILRGSGLLGLAGILPQRKIAGLIIIRPLIEIPRTAIEAFLKAKKIKSRIDSSNLKEIYFRNRIRHKLLPEIRRYNPNIKRVLANMAGNIAADYDYLLKNGLKAFGKLKNAKGPSKIKINLKGFLKLHPALQNMVLRLAYEELKGDTRRLSYQHVKELRDLAYSRPHGSIVDLPSRISVSKSPQSLCVYAR